MRCQILMLKCSKFDSHWDFSQTPLPLLTGPTSKGRERVLKGREGWDWEGIKVGRGMVKMGDGEGGKRRKE